jgi:hypothetical protein
MVDWRGFGLEAVKAGKNKKKQKNSNHKSEWKEECGGRNRESSDIFGFRGKSS